MACWATNLFVFFFPWTSELLAYGSLMVSCTSSPSCRKLDGSLLGSSSIALAWTCLKHSHDHACSCQWESSICTSKTFDYQRYRWQCSQICSHHSIFFIFSDMHCYFDRNRDNGPQDECVERPNCPQLKRWNTMNTNLISDYQKKWYCKYIVQFECKSSVTDLVFQASKLIMHLFPQVNEIHYPMFFPIRSSFVSLFFIRLCARSMELVFIFTPPFSAFRFFLWSPQALLRGRLFLIFTCIIKDYLCLCCSAITKTISTLKSPILHVEKF